MTNQMILPGITADLPSRLLVDSVTSARANYGGRRTEYVVQYIAEIFGFRVFSRQKIGTRSLTGKKSVVDLVVYGMQKYPDGLIVEVKQLKNRGSQEDKLFLLVKTAKECYPLPTLIVVVGNGISQATRLMLQRESSCSGGKLMYVGNLDEFMFFCEDQAP